MGPVWFPTNYALIEALQKFYQYYGDLFTMECPIGSKVNGSLLDAANLISKRLISMFEIGTDGKSRPSLRLHPKLATDPHFRDNLLFFEHFHGDTGRGLGAQYQTGWTGLVAKIIQASHAGVSH